MVSVFVLGALLEKECTMSKEHERKQNKHTLCNKRRNFFWIFDGRYIN